MEAQFWQDKWAKNEIGFHQADINPHLAGHWSKLNVPQGAQVFVPLCGKSRDMLWLREQGHPVLGIELCEMAVKAFFAENNLPVSGEDEGKLRRYQTENMVIYCGDFFALSTEQLSGVSAVYDRASLIALPPPMRARYARHLLQTLPDNVRMLLVTMQYDQSAMAGPPFSVTPEEVSEHYAAQWTVEQVGAEDILQQNPVFIERGLKRLQENSYVLA